MKAQSSVRAATLLAAIGVVGTVSAARAEIVTATVTGIFGAATDLYLFFPNSPSPVTLDGDPFPHVRLRHKPRNLDNHRQQRHDRGRISRQSHPQRNPDG